MLRTTVLSRLPVAPSLPQRRQAACTLQAVGTLCDREKNAFIFLGWAAVTTNKNSFKYSNFLEKFEEVTDKEIILTR